MFTKKDRVKYDSSIKEMLERICNLESQVEYFKFKDKNPSGIKVSVHSTLNSELKGSITYQYSPFTQINSIYIYTVTATWCDDKQYCVNTQELISSYGRPIEVRRASFSDGIITVAIGIHRLDGEYVIKWNTNSKTAKVSHNGIEIPFPPTIQDGKIIFKSY